MIYGSFGSNYESVSNIQVMQTNINIKHNIHMYIAKHKIYGIEKQMNSKF